jgi:hypothetical protein
MVQPRACLLLAIDTIVNLQMHAKQNENPKGSLGEIGQSCECTSYARYLDDNWKPSTMFWNVENATWNHGCNCYPCLGRSA